MYGHTYYVLLYNTPTPVYMGNPKTRIIRIGTYIIADWPPIVKSLCVTSERVRRGNRRLLLLLYNIYVRVVCNSLDYIIGTTRSSHGFKPFLRSFFLHRIDTRTRVSFLPVIPGTDL